MPIYEYACAQCGRTFEKLHSRRTDGADVACPGCHSRTVERQMSRPAAARSGGGGAVATPACGPIG